MADGEFPLLSRMVVESKAEVVSALLEAGADANARDSLGGTPAVYASMAMPGASAVATAKALVVRGANFAVVSPSGDRCIDIAIDNVRGLADGRLRIQESASKAFAMGIVDTLIATGVKVDKATQEELRTIRRKISERSGGRAVE